MLHVFLYNLVVNSYFLGIRAAAFWQEKARKWVAGRKGLFEELEAAFVFQKTDPQPVVWFHCASLGEFEQGRTVIEQIKKERPAIRILLTFFSPSGYEMRKNDPLADWVFYLPADSKANALRFIQITRPTIAVFVKYEFWFHYLTELKFQQIPTFLIAAVFRSNQPFFQWYGSLHRKMLHCFTMLFVQDETSINLLSTIGIMKFAMAGDPRIDRVLAMAGEGRQFPDITQFCGDNPVLVAGSTWLKDEVLLFGLATSPVFKGWKMIIAPHDISPKRIGEVLDQFGDRSVRHTGLTPETTASVLIIDSIGKLAWLYQYGQVAYIGGGFGQGIHNTLEPMAFNLPVIYGPNHLKFVEAREMKQRGGHFVVQSSQDLCQVLGQLSDPDHLSRSKRAISSYLHENQGASRTIIRAVLEYL